MPFSPLRKKLTSEGTLVVTVNNKPFAMMISVDEENVHDILLMLSRIRTQMTACAIRSQAPRDGVNN